MKILVIFFFFFFQAEDGIRDGRVTGVQTCALPILFALAVLPVAAVSAQEAAPAASSSPAPTVSNATPATAADMEALREQVQSLTETVKALQEQVKDQQAALEKANLTGESGLPENPEPSPIAGAEESPAPAGSAPPRFPTEDTSVVTSTTAQP